MRRLLEPVAQDGHCVRYGIRGGGGLVVSAALGVTRLDQPARVRTPDGLGAGSTVGAVRAVYPWASDNRLGVSAGVPAEDSPAFYLFVTTEPPIADEPVADGFTVTEMWLAPAATDCAPAL